MTIGIGVIDRSQNKIYVAADTLISYGSELKRPAGSKFLITENNILVVGAGSVRTTQIFNMLIKEQPALLHITSELEAVALADIFYEKMSDLGVGEADNNETPNHEFEFLIANQLSQKLFIIEGDYSVEEFSDYACIGSGFVQAQAALKTLYDMGITGRKALDGAMRTVLALHPHCGGDVEVRELPLQVENS
jgi:ATP-dependent protease HslVU (ClpYQ) peptidase subunit